MPALFFKSGVLPGGDDFSFEFFSGPIFGKNATEEDGFPVQESRAAGAVQSGVTAPA